MSRRNVIIVISPQRKLTEVKPDRASDDKWLEQLQSLVGGYIERCAIGDLRTRQRYQGVSLLVDEEGRMKSDKQRNAFAGALYGEPMHGQPIYGPAVLVGEDESNFT